MPLTIGKLAKQAGVTIETIRYYQRKGLLEEPRKPAMGYRQYPKQAISRIRFIKRAQQTGFTLKEILELLTLDSGHCHDVKELAAAKLIQIDNQIQDLTRLRTVLQELVNRCASNEPGERCSLIDSLSQEPDSIIHS
jgi:MerR family mercuric resistance operon transcriptional regulator